MHFLDVTSSKIYGGLGSGLVWGTLESPRSLCRDATVSSRESTVARNHDASINRKLKSLDFFQDWRQIQVFKRAKGKLSWGQVQSLARGSIGSLRSPTCIPSAAAPASYHKAELQRRSDGLPSKLSHPFGSKMRPDAHIGFETRPLSPVLTCTPSGTGFTIILLWDPGRHPGKHCQAPSSVCQLPSMPSPGPHPIKLGKYREPQPGWARVRKDHLDNCGCNFPGSLSGLDRNSHADGGSLEPQSDSGFLRTL